MRWWGTGGIAGSLLAAPVVKEPRSVLYGQPGDVFRTLAFMRNHGDFRPVAIIVDGFAFDEATFEDMAALRAIAREGEAELWMSAVSHRDATLSERGVPEPVAHLESDVDVILSMAHDMKAVHVSLLKDHDNPSVADLRLALDPTTMLLKRER